TGWAERTLQQLHSPQRARTVLVRVLRQPLPEATEGLEREIQRWRTRVCPRVLESVQHIDQKGRLGGKKVRRQVRKALRRMEPLLQAAATRPDMTTAHQLRIGAKKLRYLAELYDAGLPEACEAITGALVPLQDLLGELHDADVHLRLLKDLAGHGPVA